MPYFLYILECKDGTLYTGITTDVKRRFGEHKTGRGGHYTRTHGALKLLYTEEHPDKSSALKRESEIKTWNRPRKLALVSNSIR